MKWTYGEDEVNCVIKVIKAVQVEELVPLTSRFFADLDCVVNRRSASEWAEPEVQDHPDRLPHGVPAPCLPPPPPSESG